MKNLNARGTKSIVSDLLVMPSKHSVTASKVAMDAMVSGVGVMSSNGGYISPGEFFKSNKVSYPVI